MPEQYVINAFEQGPFTGNPAAVVPLEAWLDDSVLQSVAMQNNLSETAFFVDSGESIALRWFSPTQEIDLCGHATLATAHAIYSELADTRDELRFQTLGGELVVERAGDGYSMDFPDAVPSEEEVGSDLKSAVLGALGAEAGVVKLAAGDPFVVLPDPGALVSLSPNMEALSVLPGNMTIVSAPGEGAFDVVSRVFGPAVGIPEDPATGSAHCSISPYWGQRLAKVVITSQQASARGGYFKCRWRQPDGRVDLIGLCSTFSRGTIDI